MELVNDFTVNTSIDEAWATLTNVELIAPCLPGAQLQEVDGDTYRGVVKVKVGPILAQFKGEATWVERDDVNHRAVLKGKGRDTGGKGNAEALITAQAEAAGPNSTKVTVTTDLTITGKVAQFGRGALADVSTKLLGQFVDNLESQVLAPQAAARAAAPVVEEQASMAPAETAATEASTAPSGDGGAAAPKAASTGPRKIDAPEAQPIDLLETAGASMLKRLAPIGLIVVVLLLLLRRRRKG
ncbi:MAG: SRPBCC family protein [Acidimicrobiales bacterium]